jgi:molecular chaperone HscA
MEKRLLIESRVEARRTANAVRSALAADADLVDASERATLEQAIAAVESAIGGSDREAIVAAAEALEQASKPFAERRMDRGIRAALAGKRIDALEANSKTPDA